MLLEPEAFDSLYRSHAGAIERYFRGVGCDADRAREAVNETFFSAFVHRGLYTPDVHGDVARWLELEARVHHLRQRRSQHGVTEDPALTLTADHPVDDVVDAAATDELEFFELPGDRIIARLLQVEPRRLPGTLARIVAAGPSFGLDVGRSLDARALALLRETRSRDLVRYLREELYGAQSRGWGLAGVLENLAPLLSPFARATILGPDGRPVDPERERVVEVSVAQVSDELLTRLAHDPELVHALTSRQFEELLAELFCRRGYEVRLTAATRDGGADLHVVDHQALGSFLYLVECKKHRADRPVSVGVVRQLFGVVQAMGASAGIVATTSYFTRDAHAMARDQRYQLSLRDFAALQRWLRGDWRA